MSGTVFRDIIQLISPKRGVEMYSRIHSDPINHTALLKEEKEQEEERRAQQEKQSQMQQKDERAMKEVVHGIKKNINNKFELHPMCRPFSKDKMTAEQRLNLNWVQKWTQHGRFPWKFIIHALLTIACTLMVFLQTSDQTDFTVSMEATWHEIFFPNEFEYQPDSTSNVMFLYSIGDCRASMEHAINQYEIFPNVSVNEFVFVRPTSDLSQEQQQNISRDHQQNDDTDGEQHVSSGVLTVYSYKDCSAVYDTNTLDADTQTLQSTFVVSPKNMGPLTILADSELRVFFYCMKFMTLDFRYINTHLDYSHPLSYQFDIQLLYDNTVQGGRVELSLAWDKTRAENLSYSKLIQMYKVILDVIIIILALTSQVLSWVSIGKAFKIFAKTRRRLLSQFSGNPKSKRASVHWNAVPVRTKLRFFNLWFVITILGNGCNIVAAVLDFFIAADAETGEMERLLLGIGTLLSWINMVRYLEFDKKYMVLISTLRKGFPSALRFTIGALPVFLGFALFGVAFFSEQTSRFGSLGQACVTLFSLQNGDAILDTFNATSNEIIVGRLYLYVFLFISIYGVANIFIAIMDDSYSSAVHLVERHSNNPITVSNTARNARNSGFGNAIDPSNDDDVWDMIMGVSGATTPPMSPTPNVSVTNSEDIIITELLQAIDQQHAIFRMQIEEKMRQILINKHSHTSPQPSSSPTPQVPSSPTLFTATVNSNNSYVRPIPMPTTTALMKLVQQSSQFINESDSSDSEDTYSDSENANLL